MLQFLSQHASTLLVSLVGAAILGRVLYKLIQDKKNRKGGCGGGCCGCASKSACPSQQR